MTHSNNNILIINYGNDLRKICETRSNINLMTGSRNLITGKTSLILKELSGILLHCEHILSDFKFLIDFVDVKIISICHDKNY